MGEVSEANAGKWTGRVEITRKKSLAVSVACMAIYCPTPGFKFKGRTFKLCVLTRWGFNFCVRSSPMRERNTHTHTHTHTHTNTHTYRERDRQTQTVLHLPASVHLVCYSVRLAICLATCLSVSSPRQLQESKRRHPDTVC